MRKISIMVIILLLWGQMAIQVFAAEKSGDGETTIEKSEAVSSQGKGGDTSGDAADVSVPGQGEESLAYEKNNSSASPENKGNSTASEDKQSSNLLGQSESSASPDKNEDASMGGNKDSSGISDRTDDQMQTTGTLRIDNQNIYVGMNRAYKNGYQPTCEKGKVMLVLPLICDEKLKNNTITASVELGNTDNSPFIFRNYEKDFRCKPEKINGTQETKDVFLVSFSLDLNKSRINGVYPITVNVSGMDESGGAVQNTFTNYVTITDGIDPNASDDADKGETTGVSEENPT